MIRPFRTAVVLSGLFLATAASAQSFPTADPVIRRIWAEGMGQGSQAWRLAQVLTDSIGPRLTASPGHRSAVEWLVRQYSAWGVPARTEQYGTWRAWRRGRTHIDLVQPRFRTLEGTMLAWSPGTNGPVEGDVILLPDLPDSAAFVQWLPNARGRFGCWTRSSPHAVRTTPGRPWQDPRRSSGCGPSARRV